MPIIFFQTFFLNVKVGVTPPKSVRAFNTGGCTLLPSPILAPPSHGQSISAEHHGRHAPKPQSHLNATQGAKPQAPIQEHAPHPERRTQAEILSHKHKHTPTPHRERTPQAHKLHEKPTKTPCVSRSHSHPYIRPIFAH